jgi:hypothetical protein
MVVSQHYQIENYNENFHMSTTFLLFYIPPHKFVHLPFVNDCRKLKIMRLGWTQWHNIHTEFCKNQSVASKLERGYTDNLLCLLKKGK